MAFTSLDNLIAIDSSDLKFFEDVKVLNEQFQHIVNGSIIGLAPDLSPSYFTSLQDYRRDHPGSIFGHVGRFQGE